MDAYKNVKSVFVAKSTQNTSQFFTRSEQLLSSFKGYAVQASFLSSVAAALHATQPLEPTDYLLLKRDIGAFASGRLIQSIVFNFKTSSIVFSNYDGLYPANEYYDQELLAYFGATLPREGLWVANRQVTRPFAQATQQLTSYICQVPVHE